jgi:mannose-6-phosphate isomerase-like protein (cupin superfamily)
MKTKLFLGIMVIVLAGFAVNERGEADTAIGAITPSPTVSASPVNSPEERAAAAPEFMKLADAKWDKILPDLGKDSPEICILHVDPETHATSLLIRTSKAIHIRKHWHTANETHTMIKGTAKLACDGTSAEIGPGGFNFMPAKMVHEAWLPANSLTFITVDDAWDINWVEGPPTAADLSRTH